MVCEIEGNRDRTHASMDRWLLGFGRIPGGAVRDLTSPWVYNRGVVPPYGGTSASLDDQVFVSDCTW